MPPVLLAVGGRGQFQGTQVGQALVKQQSLSGHRPDKRPCLWTRAPDGPTEEVRQPGTRASPAQQVTVG